MMVLGRVVLNHIQIRGQVAVSTFHVLCRLLGKTLVDDTKIRLRRLVVKIGRSVKRVCCFGCCYDLFVFLEVQNVEGVDR
jgi:hypothetical protein